MVIVHICELFGWTYQEYMDQPTWFIKLIREKLRIDGEKAKQEQANK